MFSAKMSARYIIGLAALVLFAAHAAGLAVLGFGPTASLFSNLVSVLSGLLAAGSCYLAGRRSSQFSLRLWSLVGGFYLIWAAGMGLWTYYENYLRTGLPNPSPTDLVFYLSYAPMTLALLLPEHQEERGFQWQRALDLTQAIIVLFTAYLYFFYIPSLWQVDQRAVARQQRYFFDAFHIALTSGFLLRARFTRLPQVRAAMGRMGLLFLLYSISTGIGNYAFLQVVSTSGSVWDLAWTLPATLYALAAATWKEPAVVPAPPRRAGTVELVAVNFLPTLLPLLVLLMAQRIVQEQVAVAAAAVLASFLCYSARLAGIQHRQQQALQAHERAEQKFRVLFAHSSLPMWVYDPETLEFLEVNETATEQYGYSREEFLKMKITDVRPAEDVPKLMQALQGPPENWPIGPWRHRRKDGLLMDMEVRGKTIEFAGKPARLVVLQDVSERVSAERKLVATEAQFRGLVEQLVGITYIAEVGKAGRWHYVSPQIQSLLGFTPEEWMADPLLWSRQVHPEDRDSATAAEEAAAKSGVLEAEYRMLTRDGRAMWMRDTARLFRDYPSPQLVLQGLMLDITEQKQLEAQLRQSQKMEAVGTLAGGIAHDFNNLLTVIRGYSQLLGEKLARDSEMREEMRQIEQAADRAASLTSQLLAFSRKQMLQPQLFDLNGVVMHMDKMLRRVIGEDVELITRPAPTPAMVKADPGQIEQVVMNLAVNARDAMPRGGQLRLETAIVELNEAFVGEHEGARVGKHVMLSMRDTGVGMDANTVAHIFEPFFTTKEMGRGTGLGLSTVYGIVKQSGGYISVSSEPGKGTAFRIYLPQEEEARKAVSEPGAAAPARGSETILVLEDDEALRKFTCRVLAASGYTVLPAWAGSEAQRICREHPGEIHLLVTDMVMPDQSGVDAARLLLSRRPALKVLYVSGYSPDRVLKELGSEAAFLQKPFTTAVLTSKVREVLDSIPLSR